MQYLYLVLALVALVAGGVGLYFWLNRDTCENCQKKGGVCKYIVDGGKKVYKGCTLSK